MEDLIRILARSADLDSVTVEFVAHTLTGQQEWRASGFRTDRRISVMGRDDPVPVPSRKWGALGDTPRNALVGLAEAVGYSVPQMVSEIAHALVMASVPVDPTFCEICGSKKARMAGGQLECPSDHK